MTGALLILSILALGFGILSLSQATMGVGFCAVACYLGIVARIVQAGDHNRKQAQAEGARMRAAAEAQIRAQQETH